MKIFLDGCAIAHSVSKHLMSKRCRIMFSTHYHELTREYESREGVLIYHMSILEPEEGDNLELCVDRKNLCASVPDGNRDRKAC